MQTNQKKMTPKQFLLSKGIKVKVGDILNPTELGMPAHDLYGTLPVVAVTEVKDDQFVSGTFVRAIAMLGGDVSKFVAPSVLARLQAKVAERTA